MRERTRFSITPLAGYPRRMTKPGSTDHFTKDASRGYDERNAKLASISENMHFLIRLVLAELPERARVLCVGVGTGAEILSLARAYPSWTFVGVDPSESMLEVCAARLKSAGVYERCELVHGYVQDAPTGALFDAAISVLVAHFVKKEERPSFLREMTNRLKRGGTLVTCEIAYDLDAPEFPSMLKQWEKVQTLMGATPESLAGLPKTLRETLTVLSPSETEALLVASGVETPVRFFQSFMIAGWYGKKTAG